MIIKCSLILTLNQFYWCILINVHQYLWIHWIPVHSVPAMIRGCIFPVIWFAQTNLHILFTHAFKSNWQGICYSFSFKIIPFKCVIWLNSLKGKSNMVTWQNHYPWRGKVYLYNWRFIPVHNYPGPHGVNIGMTSGK